MPAGPRTTARQRTLRRGSCYGARMRRPLFADAYEHHVWATLRSIDACVALTPEQLAAPIPGTYGPILDTMRHLVGADSSYLSLQTDGRVALVETDHLDLPQLREAMEGNGAGWSWLLTQDLDPDSVVVRHREDGSESHAPMGVRLAQALHHGTDHRSQICTALTTLGVEPPAIDVWDYADQDGRLLEIPAPP